MKCSKVEQPNEAYLRYAHGIISEYLADELSTKLLKQLSLPEEAQNTSSKRKSVTSTNPEPKKAKFDTPETAPKIGILDLSKQDPKQKPVTVSTKEKARAKAASGSKNISSFFKKK